MALINSLFSLKVRPIWLLSLLLALSSFFFLYGLGSYGLLNNNEGLYSHIAKDFSYVLGKDFSVSQWVIPHLNGFPYIEKPPLLYWLIAFSFKVFGVNEFSARLVPALSGLGLIGWGYYFFTRLQKQTFLFPSLMILLSSLGFVIFSRMVFFEGLLTFLSSVALLEFYLWYALGKKTDLYLSYLFLGLACLTKGFAPVCLSSLIVLLFFWVDKTPWKKVFQFFNPLGIALFLLVNLPWLLCAGFYEEKFFWFYLVNEHVLRFLGQRLPKDYYSGPIYYYVPRVLGYLFPWTFFLGTFFLKLKTLTDSEKTLYRFLGLWFFVPLIFFSLSQAKANYYMIIAQFPLATLLGINLWRCLSMSQGTFVLWIKRFTSLLILGLLITPLFVRLPDVQFSGGLFFIALFVIIVFEILSRNRPQERLNQLLVQITCLSGILLLWLLQSVNAMQSNALISSKSLAAHISSLSPRPMFFFRNYEELSSLPFYLNSSFSMLDSQSADLAFAQSHPRSAQKFSRSVNFCSLTNQPVLIVVHPKSLEAFHASCAGAASHQIYQQNGVYIFELNPPKDLSLSSKKN